MPSHHYLISYICSLTSLILALPPSPSARPLRPSPNQNHPPPSTNHALLLPHLTALTHPSQNTTTLHASPPQCYPTIPPPKPPFRPIGYPHDCYDAMLVVIDDFDPEEPVRWLGRELWRSGTCFLHLEPRNGRRRVRDKFSRGEITRKALEVVVGCVNEAFSFAGGKVPVGEGVFDVWVTGGRLSGENGAGEIDGPMEREGTVEVKQERALPLRLPSPTNVLKPNLSTTAPLINPFPSRIPQCYPPTPHHPTIIHPSDCIHAIDKVSQGAPFYPETWDWPAAWSYGSCAVWLTPNADAQGELVADRFPRVEIKRAAELVRERCVVSEEGRGGWVTLGGKGVWAVRLIVVEGIGGSVRG